MLITNNFIYIIDTFFIHSILWLSFFLILFIRSNSSSFTSKLSSSNFKNQISPDNPEIDPDDPDDSDDDILKKIKKHLNKYKVEYIIGGSVLSFFIFICYYYNISLEDITNYFIGADPSSPSSDEEGSETSQSSQSFENIDINEVLNLLDKQMVEELVPIDFLDISKAEDNELVRLRPDLDESSENENELVRLRPDLDEISENQSNQSFEGTTTDDFENMSIDEALDLLDNEITQENEYARLRAQLEEASMERIRREADESINNMKDITMKHITDQLWGKDQGPFI